MALVASPQTPIRSGSRQSHGIIGDVEGDSSAPLNDNGGLGGDCDDMVSFSSPEYLSPSSSGEYLSSSDDEPEFRSPHRPRKSRTRTVEVQSPLRHVASSERVRRNTDSMLEDALVADRLRRRLVTRREQTARRSTIAHTGLSDFILRSITEGGSLDAVSAAMPTDGSLSRAADVAFHACMAGYFGGLEDEDVVRRLKRLFTESLERVEFGKGEYICRQDEPVDKLFVVEEGMVRFSCGGQVAGEAGTGAVLGELSLVYGIPAPSDVRCITPCVILWAMDALAYRRVQAVVAKESLRSAMLERLDEPRDSQIQTVRRKCSSFLDLQEQSDRPEANNIPFDRLERVAVIGRGAFGSVCIVRDRESSSADERCYSLKCMSKSSIVERGNEKRVLIEKHALQASVPSPFVISLFGTYQDDDCIYFLTDFVQGGNLMRRMINMDVLPHEECVFFCACIAAGLAFLHGRGFVHRDVKPENCLIGADGYLRLCDCGMAKRLPSTVQLPSGGTEAVALAFTMCGTPEFMAPEFVLSTGYGRGVDWWALGCILVEMYAGRSPFEFEGDLKRTFREVCLIGMGRGEFVPPGEMDEEGLDDARDLARRLLSRSSERLGRRGGRRVRDHAYFSGIDFAELGRGEARPPYVPNISHPADSSHFDVEREDTERETEPYTGSNDIFRDF